MEGDLHFLLLLHLAAHISIHSLRMEGDRSTAQEKQYTVKFQSTPSAWRETGKLTGYDCPKCISIHSLRMEGDVNSPWRLASHDSFQSTPSAWRETLVIIPFNARFTISIHSLRMEGDYHRLSTLPLQCYFNPLPPHGGRRWVQDEKAS